MIHPFIGLSNLFAALDRLGADKPVRQRANLPLPLENKSVVGASQ